MVDSWPAGLVGERTVGMVGRVRGADAVNGGSEPLIFVPRAAHTGKAADPHAAAQIELAHQAAVPDALSFIERHALFTRQGRNGSGRST